MNRLVMNFFVTEGYVEAAEKFQRESRIEIGIDLGTIIDRMAVKKAVQCGNVEDTIVKVNDLNPKICSGRRYHVKDGDSSENSVSNHARHLLDTIPVVCIYLHRRLRKKIHRKTE